jgi:hypothetical protein
MSDQKLIKQVLAALEFIPESGSMLGTAAEARRLEAVNLLRNRLADPDRSGSPCPEFWDWLPRAYRDGDLGTEAKFTKYNMEVAFFAGKHGAQATTPQQQDPVAWMTTDQTLVERGYNRFSHTRSEQWNIPVYAGKPTKGQAVRKCLTDEDIHGVLAELQNEVYSYTRPPTIDTRILFARAIEKKLWEKNT